MLGAISSGIHLCISQQHVYIAFLDLSKLGIISGGAGLPDKDLFPSPLLSSYPPRIVASVLLVNISSQCLIIMTVQVCLWQSKQYAVIIFPFYLRINNYLS